MTDDLQGVMGSPFSLHHLSSTIQCMGSDTNEDSMVFGGCSIGIDSIQHSRVQILVPNM